MTECGRFVSPEITNFNFSGQLLILRSPDDVNFYFDMCDEEYDYTPLVHLGDSPVILVINGSIKNCDTSDKYKTAVALRERGMTGLKALFLISSESQRRILSDSAASESESLANAELPVFQSDFATPGLMNALQNGMDNARTYLRNVSRSASEAYSLQVAITLVYGKSVPATVFLGTSLTMSKTSVLFVAISFMTLVLVSLAWLLVYYVQRFRYTHAKDRVARRLERAARKALARIATRSLKVGDAELASDETVCPVCIEPYAADQLVRTLPCRHIFHRSCVDAWLLEQRSCPVCKLDILKAFGLTPTNLPPPRVENRRHPPESSVRAVFTRSDDADSDSAVRAHVTINTSSSGNTDEPQETNSLMHS